MPSYEPQREIGRMTETDDAHPGCLVCGRLSEELPLIAFRYQGSDLWICSQHLPVLIHDPQSLAGILPGAEGMVPADHTD
jgi:hypothetical protein